MASETPRPVLDAMHRLFGPGNLTALSERQLLERFLTQGDHAAFETILERHGPMVLAVCRRILDDPHDVDDAFQATFLVLLKNARSIREHEHLGPWLWGVARRVATRARVTARRRKSREKHGTTSREMGVEADRLETSELKHLVDDELAQLPARYRSPLVLCDLEGQTHEQAAEALHCPVGTIKSRLSRGRERLRARLVRRGVAPTAAVLGATLADRTAQALPPALVRLTLDTLASRATIPSTIAALAAGAVRSMAILKWTSAAALVTVLVAVAGTQLAADSGGPDPETPPRDATNAQTAPIDAPNSGPPAVIEASALDESAQSYRLENGLRVILRPIQGMPFRRARTALVVLYSLGEDQDPEGRSGLAHLLEHVNVGAKTNDELARDNSKTRRKLTDERNGQTGGRYTVLTASFAPNLLNEELHDAAARMRTFQPTAADLDRERPRLLEEVDNMFGHSALGALNRAQAFVHPVPGTGRKGGQPEHVQELTLDDLRDRWQRYYKPANAILAVAGAFDVEAARKTIESEFATIPQGEPAPPFRPPGKPRFGVVQEFPAQFGTPGMGSTVELAYLAPAPESNLYAPFLVLVARLWSHAPHPRKGDLDQGIGVYFTPLDDGTIVGVSTYLPREESAANAVKRLETFVARTLETPLGNDDRRLVRDKFAFILGTLRLSDAVLENNPYSIAFSLARRVQLGFDTRKLSRSLDALTDQDLRRAYKTIFSPERHSAVIVRK